MGSFLSVAVGCHYFMGVSVCVVRGPAVHVFGTSPTHQRIRRYVTVPRCTVDRVVVIHCQSGSKSDPVW